jgi:hypothetical protein
MHEEELEDLAECWECGAPVAPGADGAYVFGEDEDRILCQEWPKRRGGEYDAVHDRWTREPDVADLPDERRPHL